MRKRKCFRAFRSGLSLLLAMLLVLQVWPWQQRDIFAASKPLEQRKFIRVEPAVFQPSQGETVKIRWNWEQDHPTVIKLMKGDQVAAILQEEKHYAGGYVTHEFKWNGNDSRGARVPEGTYDVLVEPQDKYKAYGSIHPVTVLGQGGADIAISPKATGDRFLVYGNQGTRHGVRSVKLTISANGAERTVDAKVEENRWSVEVGITPYTQTRIEANLTGGSSGKPGLTVTNHPYRLFDDLDHLAMAYYGDERNREKIIKDNMLGSAVDENSLVGHNILIFNQTHKVHIYEQEPVLGGNMGVVDMYAGTNTNTPAHMGMGNNVGITSDLYIGGSFPLFFTRTYNSRDDYFSMFGSGWSHTFSERLRDLDKSVLIRFEDGHAERYDKQQDGTYRAGTGIYNQLSRQTDGRFILKTSEREKIHFDAKGLPVAYENEQGVALHLTYTGERLSRAEREGNVLTFHYNAVGQLTEIRDQDSRKVSYTYTGNALTGMTDPEGGEYRYSYDAEGRVHEVVGPDRIVLRSMKYDSKGRLTSIRYEDGSSQTYTYDEAKGIVTLKEGTGLATAYHYDDQLRLTKIVNAKGEQTFSYPDSTRTTAANSNSNPNSNPPPQNNRVASLDNNDSKTGATSTQAGSVVNTGGIGPVGNAGLASVQAASSASSKASTECSAAAWDAKKVYVAGDYAQYDGKTWMAKWWTLGEVPKDKDWDVWKPVEGCGTSGSDNNGSSPDPGTNPGANPETCQATAWDSKKVYVNGDHVMYNGSMWRAKWWTLGEVPGAGDEWSVWKKVTSCSGDQGEEVNPNPPDPAYDEAIFAPDNGSNPLRVDMFNHNRTDQINTMYPWYRLHNISDSPIQLSDIRIRYFFTSDSKERLMFWGDWPSIGGNNQVNGTFTRLKQPGMNVDTVLEISFDEGSGVIKPGAALDLHTRISKERWIDFKQTNDYSFNAQDTDYSEWDRIAVFVRGQWVWGSMPNAAAMELAPPAGEGGLELPEYYSKEPAIQNKDANGATTSYKINERGQILEVKDALGNTSSYNYDSEGRLTSATDPLGNRTTLVYDSHGNLTAVTDAEGHTTKYAYNAKGLPTDMTAPDGSKLTILYDGKGNPVEIKDGEGAVHKRHYDNLNRMVEAVDPASGKYRYVYSPTGNLEQITDPLGQVTTMTYNKLGQQEQLIAPGGGKSTYNYNSKGQLESVSDALGQLTKYMYDAHGRPERIIAPDGGITQYNYDLYGRVSSVTDAEGGKTSYQYDAMDNLIRETDARGNSVSYTYDLLGRLIETKAADGAVTKTSYDAAGRVKQWTDAGGGVTRFEYDGNGQLLQKTDPLGQTERFKYTPNGQLAAITDAAGNVTKYEYDGNGRLVAEIDALNQRNSYVYDAVGRLVKETNALGKTTSYSYDDSGQLVSMTDAGGQVTRFTYTPLGQIASEIDALNRKTMYEYDLLGQLISVTDAKGNKTGYSYDGAGNRMEQIRYGLNQEKQTTRYTYDKLGRRVEETNPLGLQTKYAYDPVGNLLSVTAPDGQVTKHTYDKQNRLQETVYADQQRATFTYDKLGELVSMKDWNGETRIKRDQLGQIVSVTDPKGRTINYTWTSTGLKEAIAAPDGRKVNYSYNANQQLTEVKDAAGITRYTYNAAGQITGKEAANGSKTTFAYDPSGRLQQIQERNRSGASINEHTYRYDEVGNITDWVEKIGGQTRNKKYAYDELGQLIQAAEDGQTTQYTYDAYGNRKSKKTGHLETIYTYNAANQLLQEKSGALSKNYEYDKRGNLIAVLGGPTPEKYTYNAADRLVSAVRNDQSMEYRYTAQGARIQSKDVASNKTQEFLIDLTSAYNDVLAVYEGQTVQESYTYGLNRLHASLSNGTTETYTYDHLGSIVGLQDQQGNLKTTYRYDEFGIQQASGTPGSPQAIQFGYTGYPYEPTGLSFAQARYYNPELGRFISEDTYEGEITNPLSLNRYTYVENNPLRFIDPSGHILEDIMGIKNNRTDPIKINISENIVAIDVYVSIYGNAADKQLGGGKTYRQMAIDGMVSYWSGSYSDVYGEKVKVELNIVDLGRGIHMVEKGQKSVLINIVDEIGVSNVKYSSNIFGYRRWSKSSVGKTTLYVGDGRSDSTNPFNEKQFMWVAAHELGHNLGVTDAYSSKRGNTITSVFNKFDTSVQNVDIEKVLKAFQLNKQQNW